jgi:hypothetical protein
MKPETRTIYPERLPMLPQKREFVAMERPVNWTPPSILRPPEVLTESELVEAESELKALQTPCI